ncbi:YggT family protein [Lactobacillus agrestimuris]|uniref:YggT family protein n=1 Tax=Lactobacillus agrestimuris TaxID=2941328 RepID=UPI0019A97DE0|nr:YggT family protein [Lactobacillus agrestimuris]MBD5431552.1 YggT family protein [Lactobacillus sp.]
MVVYSIISIIDWLIWLYCLLIVISAILSWVPMLYNSAIGQFLNKIVDPYLSLFRRGPLQTLANNTGIDISPIIAIFVLYFIQDYVLRWVANILFKLVG